MNINKIEIIKNKCLIGTDKYSLECVYQNVCSQMDQYFIRMGLIIIIFYGLITWFLWWFLNYGYKKFRYNKTSKIGLWIGDLDDIDRRIYIDTVIRSKITKVAIAYIGIVVYMNWRS